MIDIISRLPIKTIASCKPVCKSWLNLLTSAEFVKSHLSKSKSVLILSAYEYNEDVPSLYRLTEFDSYSAITVFSFMEFSGCRKNNYMTIVGSVDGLIFCRKKYCDTYYVFNPVTQEYIELPHPKERALGFGVSKMNGQYKMVRIYFRSYKFELLTCKVYTLGKGSWRTVPLAPDASLLRYCSYTAGAFLNGNLHWLAKDFEGLCWISYFDLQTELFSKFSIPFGNITQWMKLMVSGDCLHLIHYGYGIHDTVVWFLKEYGVGESWTKDCVISKISYMDCKPYGGYRVINVFSNGDVLIGLYGSRLLYYSRESNTGGVIYLSELPRNVYEYKGMLHSPSFLSLKSFAMEDVKLFQRIRIRSSIDKLLSFGKKCISQMVPLFPMKETDAVGH